MSPTGREKTGYATQKPVGILRRIVAASSAPGDWVSTRSPAAGRRATAARALGRRFVLVDANPDAVDVMRARLGDGVLVTRDRPL